MKGERLKKTEAGVRLETNPGKPATLWLLRKLPSGTYRKVIDLPKDICDEYLKKTLAGETEAQLTEFVFDNAVRLGLARMKREPKPKPAAPPPPPPTQRRTYQNAAYQAAYGGATVRGKLFDADPLTTKRRTYVVMLVDESGSMDHLEAAVNAAIREWVQTLQQQAAADANQEVIVSLYRFSYATAASFENVAAGNVNPISDYCPDGGTALWDAIHSVVARVEAQPFNADTAVLFSIITDGEENASRHYRRYDVERTIARLNATNRWTITYIGANQDVRKLLSVGLDAGNVAEFVATPAGVAEAARSTTKGTQQYFTLRAQGVTRSTSFYDLNKK